MKKYKTMTMQERRWLYLLSDMLVWLDLTTHTIVGDDIRRGKLPVDFDK